MGYFYLLLSKLASVAKIVSVKKCGSIATGAKNSVKINLLRSFGCLVVAVFVSLFSGFESMSMPGVFMTVLSGISNGFLLFSWILAAACAPMITVEVFCMIGGVVVPLILSPIVLDGEKVTLIQWIGALLLFAAIFCFSKRKGGGKITAKSVILMCVAGISNAGGVITQKFYQEFSKEYNCGTVADFQLGTYAITIAVLALVLLAMILIKKESGKESQQSKITPLAFLFIVIAFGMTYLSQYTATLAAGKMDSAILFPLAYVISMPMIFIVDVIFFGEKVSLRGIIGLLIVTASGVLINI